MESNEGVAGKSDRNFWALLSEMEMNGYPNETIENLLCSQGVVPVLVLVWGPEETVGRHYLTVTVTCNTGAFAGTDEARRFVFSFLLDKFMINDNWLHNSLISCASATEEVFEKERDGTVKGRS